MQLSKSSTNKEIAEAFRQVASVYQLQGKELFRTRAYENAASSIEVLSTPLKELWQENRLAEVPGLGQKFHQYVDELFRSGTIKHFGKILKTEPAGFYVLLDIPGVGPKTALKLTQQLHLHQADTAINKVRTALSRKNHSGFSEKIAAKILAAIERESHKTEHRLLLPEAQYVADDVCAYFRTLPEVLACDVLGSLRRKVATIGDVDIAVSTKDPDAVMTKIQKFPHLQKIVSTGRRMTIFVHSSGVQVDVKTQEPEAWGSMLQHYTGSKLHNIHLRTLAKEKNVSLSEYGIKKRGVIKPYKDEKSFYEALGLTYIPPELREGAGEIEAAKKGKLPKLVELNNIRGDFHVHTKMEFPSSHDLGASNIAELLKKAKELNYEYIGFSDHNPKQSGLSAIERLKAVQRRTELIHKEVAKVEKAPNVFVGLEVDILPDGNLALEDGALMTLDYAIVSIHSQFTQSRAVMTKRILKALSHPKARIFGHPTARQLGMRPEIECDWEEIFGFCAKEHKLIEINASPQRLDLPDQLIKEARDRGVTFIIDTDAHHADHMEFMKYGVWMARRGWCTSKNIANTFSLSSLKKWL